MACKMYILIKIIKNGEEMKTNRASNGTMNDTPLTAHHVAKVFFGVRTT